MATISLATRMGDLLSDAQRTLNLDAIVSRDVVLMPSFGLKADPHAGKTGKKQFQLYVPKPADQWNDSTLNPAVLADAGIESRLDTDTNTVHYTTKSGGVRIGFYDRTLIEGGHVNLSSTPDEFVHSMRQLIAATDSDTQRIKIEQIQPVTETVLGMNFPKMFNYRSVIFHDDTIYGLFVDVDKKVLGGPLCVTDLALTKEYIAENPSHMHFLFPLVLRAASQQGIDIDATFLEEIVDFGPRMHYIKSILGDKYDIKMTYNLKPALGISARMNGIPLGLSMTPDEKLHEILQGGADIGTSVIGLISKGSIHNQADPDHSYAGSIKYTKIPRAQSVELAKETPDFGLMEVVVMAGYTVENAAVTFEKKPQKLPLFESRDVDRGGMNMMRGGGSFGLTSYTAGRSEIVKPQVVSISTGMFLRRETVLRDIFCLVHLETHNSPASYHVTADKK